MDILKNIEGQFANVEKIKNQLFKVMDVSVPAPRPTENGVVFDNPKTQLIYTDKGVYLGTVGDTYKSIQPIEFLETIENSISNGTNFDLGKLEYTERSNGKIINFKLPTEIVTFKNRAGKTDEIELFLNFETGFGGTARTEIGLYSKRFICSNGMRIVDSEIQVGFKHTERMNLKAISFSEEILMVANRVQETKKVWQQMDSIEVRTATEENFKRKLLKIKDSEKIADLHITTKNIYNALSEAMQTEFNRTGHTIFGLLNGVTYYTNHLAKKSDGADGDYINVNAGAKMNKQAQELCLSMI
jgi:plasmid maintenance system killer protein